MKQLNSILMRVLNIEERTIHDGLTPFSVKTWDSLNALILVSELEKSFSVSFTMEEVRSVKCVGDIKQCLKNHGECHQRASQIRRAPLNM